MKKNLLSGLLVAGLFSLGVNAQTWNVPTNGNSPFNAGFIGTITNNSIGIRTNNVERINVSTTGWVGIGVSTPYNLSTAPANNGSVNTIRVLEVNGSIMANTIINTAGEMTFARASGRYQGPKPTDGNDGRVMVHGFGDDALILNFAGDFAGGTIIQGSKLVSEGKIGIGIGQPTAKLHVGGGISGTAIIEGSLIIGATTFPTTAPNTKLYVKGCIGAEEVRVSTTTWCDYVFNKDYNLKSLKEVDAYIQANKHLPEVPSEKEVVENGVAMGEMMKIHMKKIEELTLYMIELQKQNEKLAAEVAGLKK